MKAKQMGIICGNEAYSKAMLFERLGISQKFWDKLLDDGLPFTNVGHTRWISGRQLIDHLEKHSTTKQTVTQ